MTFLSSGTQGYHRELKLMVEIIYNWISDLKSQEIESTIVTPVKTMGSVMISVRADMIPKISRTFFQIAKFRIILQHRESLTGLIRLIHFIRTATTSDIIFTLIMNLSCIRLMFDISYFCHDLLKLPFYEWSKMTSLYRTVNLCLMKWHFYALIIYLKHLCILFARPDLPFGVKNRRTSERTEVVIFDSAMGSVRNSFIVIESI